MYPIFTCRNHTDTGYNHAPYNGSNNCGNNPDTRCHNSSCIHNGSGPVNDRGDHKSHSSSVRQEGIA